MEKMKTYSKPEIEIVQLDNAISMQMSSEPPNYESIIGSYNDGSNKLDQY